MVVTNEYIFIHAPKTGGMTTQEYLVGVHTGTSGYRRHTTFRELQTLKVDNFEGIFSFGFVRDPWNRFYSMWNFEKNQRQIPSVGDFEDTVKNAHKLNAWWTTPCADYLDGVTRVCRYEDWNNEWAFIQKKLNIEDPFVKSNGISSYRQFYTDETKTIIHDLFQKDINLFGYKW